MSLLRPFTRCLRQLPSPLPAPRLFSSSMDAKGIEQFWKGGHLDPEARGAQVAENGRSGDAWPACLLRMKSFEDLHKLWYICLKEKNFLMSERLYARLMKIQWRDKGRLKKVKMTMKRILTVLSRREIHQQCLRAKELLEKQKVREEVETRRHKIESMGNEDSLMKNAWKTALKKYEKDLEVLQVELKPLRKDTMQLLTPDWRYHRKYSDLPGASVRWQKQWVRALEERKKSFVKYY